jgi:hypothetical protein
MKASLETHIHLLELNNLFIKNQ